MTVRFLTAESRKRLDQRLRDPAQPEPAHLERLAIRQDPFQCLGGRSGQLALGRRANRTSHVVRQIDAGV